MENKTVCFLNFVNKINKASTSILSKTNYANTINKSFPHIESKIARKRKILSEFSEEEEADLKYLTDIFIKLNIDAGY